MTQSTKPLYAGDQTFPPEGLNRADDAAPFSGSACELQSVEILEPVPASEKDTLPPTGLLLEHPMEWIAERCPFGERRQCRRNTCESDSVNCLH